MSRRASLLALFTIAALSACGGGAPPADPASSLSIVLLSPDAGATLSGSATLQFEAVAPFSTITELRIDAPAQSKPPAPELDPENHRATLTVSLNAAAYPDGPLTVTVTAVSAQGSTMTRDFVFDVSSTARVVTLDASLKSFHDEAAMTVGAAVPPQYGFGSAAAVTIGSGTTIHKAATRLKWDARPTAADLEGANLTNTPTLRLLVSQPASAPALTDAKATVAIHCAGCSIPDSTIDMWPSSASPAGSSAYLVPLDGNLLPLAQVTGDATLTVTAAVKDAVGHTATGGPWTVPLVLVGPPLVIAEDVAFKTSGDSRSVYAYKSNVLRYQDLWTTTPFAAEGSVRLLHFVIQNPASMPVTVTPSLTGGGWSMTETWSSNYLQSVTHEFGHDDVTSCPPKNDLPCASGQVANYSQQDYASPVVCDSGQARSTASGTQRLTGVTGDLVLRAYKPSGAAADVTSPGAFVVPAASGGTPGKLDVYVGRSVISPRPVVWPTLTYDASAGSYRAFLRALSMSSSSEDYCHTSSGNSVSYTYSRWSGSDYQRTLTEVRETLTGTLKLVSRGLSGSNEVGAETPGASINVGQDIVH